jgi:hypothetical protein
MVALSHTTFFLHSALCTAAHSIASLLVPHEHLVIAESFQLRVAIWRLGVPVPKVHRPSVHLYTTIPLSHYSLHDWIVLLCAISLMAST